MGYRKLVEEGLAERGQADEHLAAVVIIVLAAHGVARGEPVDQFDGAVMLDLEPLG